MKPYHLAKRGRKERLVAILEMTSISQSMRDLILWILATTAVMEVLYDANKI